MTTYERIISIFATPLGYLISVLYDLIANYGITLIVFTILVRTLMLPLYASQIKSSLRMQEMQPKMQEIQKKYANDREMLGIKMSEFYKTEKFNPMGGCMPMLVQMPILFALFALLRNPLAFMGETMLMAVHESFLWTPDLSQPDPWILPFLCGIFTFISLSLTQMLSSSSGPAGSTAGMMKMMRYFFPVMIVWMARTFPSGLALYWFIGSVFQIGQTLVLRKKRAAKSEKEKNTKKK